MNIRQTLFDKVAEKYLIFIIDEIGFCLWMMCSKKHKKNVYRISDSSKKKVSSCLFFPVGGREKGGGGVKQMFRTVHTHAFTLFNFVAIKALHQKGGWWVFLLRDNVLYGPQKGACPLFLGDPWASNIKKNGECIECAVRSFVFKPVPCWFFAVTSSSLFNSLVENYGSSTGQLFIE